MVSLQCCTLQFFSVMPVDGHPDRSSSSIDVRPFCNTYTDRKFVSGLNCCFQKLAWTFGAFLSLATLSQEGCAGTHLSVFQCTYNHLRTKFKFMELLNRTTYTGVELWLSQSLWYCSHFYKMRAWSQQMPHPSTGPRPHCFRNAVIEDRLQSI
jgi:hypothetical protein